MQLGYSVITVCLNAVRTIERTVESVLVQQPAPIEYVFVDGGSTDGTRQVVDRCWSRAVNPPTQIWVDQGGARGITSAWNMGLRLVSAPIVFIINADDWYELDCAASVLGHFHHSPQTDILSGSIRIWDAEAIEYRASIHARPMWLAPFLSPLCHPATFVRRRVYEELGGFDEQYAVAADYEYIYRCLTAGKKIDIDRRILVNHEAGGFASKNRVRARREQYEVSRRYCRVSFLPLCALALRTVLSR